MLTIKNKNIKKLLEKYIEIANLNDIGALLGWDQEVNMPPLAVNSRANQLAYLTKLITDRWNDAEFKNLIETTKSNKDLTLEEAGVLRNLKESAKYYYKVPAETIIEISTVTSKAFVAWHTAKTENNFKIFLPHLKKIVDLNKQVAGYLGYKDNPYDALLDLYEQGLTAKKVQNIFNILQPKLTDLIKKIKVKNTTAKFDFASHEYAQIDQERVTNFVLKKMGYDFSAGRQDVSSHPFTTSLGFGDVRITNRYKRDNFVESIMVAMHEGGHAVYDQGVNSDYYLSPLDGGVSLGIHESQSRFWENQIGRSEEFIKFLLPILQAYYPEQLKEVKVEDLYQHFNNVKPGLIRVEADEVTYNLHIALRFELENSLLNDKIKVEDLPDIWRVKMKKYLGVVPDTDTEGVLQDIHWSHGTFGYFPTYTLGNLYSAQFTHALKKQLNLSELIEKGNLAPILKWLRDNIHQYGSLYWPEELAQRITGEKLTAKYFINYLEKKYAKIYGVKV